MEPTPTFTSFAGQRLLASGDAKRMLLQTKEYLDAGGRESILIFDDQTGAQTEFDLDGTPEEVLAKAAADPALVPKFAPGSLPPRPGRPRLGVVSKEVSLLPRHWAWLERQPSGASAALRRLVEAASKTGRAQELARRARDAAGKFMWNMAGDLANFEEATRALYAKDAARLHALIGGWPQDIRGHTARLVGEAERLERLASEDAIAPAKAD
jgi:uncharacterized protein